MRFVQLTESAYTKFTERQDRMSFTQLPEYAATRRDQGVDVALVGVVDGDPERLLAAAVVTYQPWKRLFKRANITFGPTFEEYSSDIERTFYEGLLEFVKRDKTIVSV
ncbi:MAG: aminoacyltransferase, partial [Trueperella sp.]|nr:aminoacyltransferase [Trueperella sp.]